MARRHLLMPVVMAIVVVASVAFASTAAASGLHIASPSNNRFFTKKPVEVKLRGPHAAHALSVTLDGRSVTSAFHRVSPGAWQGKLGRKQVRTGANRLTIAAVTKGKREYDRTRFTIGKRDRGLLTVVTPKRPTTEIAAKVKVGAMPEKLTAHLNGRRLRRPLGVAPGRRELLRLGADDGLHFGVNQLRVMAIRRGVYDLERRKIFVPRDRPLVGAGPDRRTAAGSSVQLDGSSSMAASGGSSPLSYSWKLVDEPRGSKAKLKRAEGVRPVLATDLPGLYRVALTVTEPGQGTPPATDVATVASVANVPPIGEPIETIVPNGGNTEETADTGIKVGTTTYWMGAPKGNLIQAVIIERATLRVLYHESFSGSAATAKTLEEEINSYAKQTSVLVAISNPELSEESGVNAAFLPIVESLGVSKAAAESIRLNRAGWSVVGVPGVKGSAYFGSGSNLDPVGAMDVRGNLSGYLEKSLSGEGGKAFGFVPSSRVPFETSKAPAATLRNTISVGGKEYASQPLAACGTGGLQAEVLLAETLAPVSGGTFTTNGCGATADAAELGKLGSLLSGITLTGGPTEGTKLVLVQSIGSPHDPAAAAAAAWNAVAETLVRLGGTAQVFAEDKAGYALVGGLGIARLPITESSQTLTGQEARITGVLEQNREGSYTPVLSSPTSLVPLDLDTIAYQPEQAWPDSSGEEDKAALAYADEILELEKPQSGAACTVPGPTETWLYLRAEYCNLRYDNQWASKATELKRTAWPSGKGFTKETWGQVTGELASEFGNVQSVWNLIKLLKEVFGTSTVSATVNLKQIALEIEKDVAPPPKSEAVGWWLELAANLASTASYYDFGVPDEVVEKTTGTLSGALFIAAQLIFGPQGAPEAEEFGLQAADFATELSEKYLSASGGLGFIGELLVSDHGKLTAVSKAGLLGISSETLNELATELGPGSRAWSYEQLMPLQFEAIGLEAAGENKPLPATANSYVCRVNVGKGLEEKYKPFDAEPEAELRATAPGESLGLLVLKGSELPSSGVEEHPRSPKGELLEHIFKTPKELKGALGLKPPWFWRSVFDYPTKSTQTVKCEG